ncbi:unnamed protein product [Agarophyton chilense]
MAKRHSSNSIATMEFDGADTRKKVQQKPVVPIVSLLAAFYYISTSVSLTLFNKLLFSRFPGSDPPFLLLSQSITAVFILTVLSFTDRIQLPQFSKWTSASIKIYAPLYLANLTMLLTSLIALKFTSLVMYNTLRRTSMIFVVAIYAFLNSTQPSIYTLTATALVTAGALWAGTTDLAFDPIGYGLAFAANLSTAIYLNILRPIRDKLQLTNLQLIFVNALANIPVLFTILMLAPRTHSLLSHFADITFSVLFFCSCAIAVVINHAIFVNTTTNDAIAQSIASQLKDVVLLVSSIAFVDDPSQRAHGNLQGVMVGFVGSLVYGVGKLVDGWKDKPENSRSTEKVSDESRESEQVALVGAESRSSG